MAFADDYVPVADRIITFRERFPEGTLRPADPSEPFRLVEVNGETFLAYTAAAYRTPDDLAPGIGCAWEPVPGKTNFTRNSELQNAESSAWGRAIIAVGAADAKKGIASHEDVRNRQAEADEYVAPPVPGFRSSLMDSVAKLTEAERELLRAWLVEEGLPDRPSKMDAEQAGRVAEWLIRGMPKVEEPA
jgi:hypothetical protein